MGLIIPPVVTALNASTYTAITMQKSLENRDITFYTDDLTAFTIATDDSGTNAATIPAGLSVTITNQDTDGTLFYALASAGTPNLVLLTATVK